MNRGVLTRVLAALICLTVGFCHFKIVSRAEGTSDADVYLSKTGMSLREIHTLDSDVREYIANDLSGSGEKEWKANRDILPCATMNSEEYAAAFYISVYAFQAKTDYRVYVVYESTAGIRPTGDDSLSLKLGDGFKPYRYGGQIWFKQAGAEGWTTGGGLTAGHHALDGGIFSGSQLGDFRRKTLVKGCVYCYAGEGEGEDRQVAVEYNHHPPKKDGGAGLYVAIVTATIIIVLIMRRKA